MPSKRSAQAAARGKRATKAGTRDAPRSPGAPVDGSLLDALRWRSIGPYRGGRCVAVAGDPTQPLVFYFGSTGGGGWETTDAGGSRRQLSDGPLKNGRGGGGASVQ